ncbi:pectin lyase fold/virulence factor [Collybia nuda]|uniref:pectinesterase n=1 Tax=Collybia nuda TaxID=64659 RepID=A0A9P6CKQ1_9AGAR|nr:pectin lyase fold/virulence factor [Collybia nuda]
MAFQRVALLAGLFALLSVFFSAQATPLEKRAVRTSPPSGSVVVRGSGTQSGEFSTLQAAVNSLPNDSSARTIFIYPGTYSEQVSITRSGKLTIYGSTTDTTSYKSNSVTITHALSAGQAGNDDLTGTLRVHKDNFALYNVNVKNTFGPHTSSGGQALALSAYGTNHGYYGVGFYGYQDTVLAEQGNQYYGSCYIEGAVDYIWGQHARAYFQKNTIASVAAGAITADGPTSSSDASLFVINQSTITTSSAATTDLTGKVYLGRPWTQYARVVYTSCSLGALINPAGWSQWSSSTPNTGNVLFAEFASSGAGAAGTRASFSKKLSSASGYGIADVLGSSWTSWVDQAYV